MKIPLTLLLALTLATPLTTHASSIQISTYESENTLTAVIQAQDITEPVIGLAFDLYFDPFTLAYLDHYEGAFFEQGGEPMYLVTQDLDHRGGKIITGISLKRTDNLVDLSGTIIAFDFDILEKKSTQLTFKNQVISTITEDGKRQDLEIEWIDSEIYFSTATEIPIQPKEQTVSEEEPEPAPEPEIAELMQASIMEPETPAALLLLLLLPPICYIGYRLLKKRRANRTLKTSNLSFKKPPSLHSP